MPKNTKRPAFVKTMDDNTWDAAPLKERFLHVMRSQVGVEEVPRGSNWGPKVKAYINSTGLNSPVYWCACFVTWCLVQAGADIRKLPKNSASTYYWWEWANETGRVEKTAARGRVALYNGDNGGHIWGCTDGAEPHTSLEGNTNPGGSSNGYGVFERKRSVFLMKSHKRWCFIRIDDSLY